MGDACRAHLELKINKKIKMNFIKLTRNTFTITKGGAWPTTTERDPTVRSQYITLASALEITLRMLPIHPSINP